MKDQDRTVLRQIVMDPEFFYVNVHTSDYPAGAVRGSWESEAAGRQKRSLGRRRAGTRMTNPAYADTTIVACGSQLVLALSCSTEHALSVDNRHARQKGRSAAAPALSCYFGSVATANCATALNVVCAAFKPSRKSLSRNVEKTSIG